MEKIVYAVNFVLVFFIVRYEYNSVSDKTIIITSLLYAGLVAANFVIGFLSKLAKERIYKHYYRSVLLMLALIIAYLFVLVVLPPSV